jgi:peptidoglycan/LPS O-acetylase OafA/YrhL
VPAVDVPAAPAVPGAAIEPYAAFRALTTFGSLDGLRAISIVAVIFHHAMGPTFSGPLATAGAHGVSLFFAISGFLITTLLLRERDRRGEISLKAFYARRVLRIFPLYYSVLGLYVVLVAAVERDAEVRQQFFENLPFFLTYTSNWFVQLDAPRVIFYFAWSLAAEEQFYMLWPPLLRAARRAAPYVVFTLLVAGETARVFAGAAPGLPPLWLRLVGSVPAAICLGVLLAFALHDPRSFRVLHRLFSGPWTGSVLLVALLGALAAGIHHLVVYGLMAALLAACVVREDHPLARPLGWSAMRSIGVRSYGMYLMHMLAYNAVHRVVARAHVETPALVFILTVAASWGIASLTYRYLEQPFLRLKSRFAR